MHGLALHIDCIKAFEQQGCERGISVWWVGESAEWSGEREISHSPSLIRLAWIAL